MKCSHSYFPLGLGRGERNQVEKNPVNQRFRGKQMFKGGEEPTRLPGSGVRSAGSSYPLTDHLQVSLLLQATRHQQRLPHESEMCTSMATILVQWWTRVLNWCNLIENLYPIARGTPSFAKREHVNVFQQTGGQFTSRCLPTPV